MKILLQMLGSCLAVFAAAGLLLALALTLSGAAAISRRVLRPRNLAPR
jgi:hypothetical protein